MLGYITFQALTSDIAESVSSTSNMIETRNLAYRFCVPRSKTQNGMLPKWDIMKISIAAHITSQSNKRSSKVRLHGNILPDDNDDKVKDVVSVRKVFPRESQQL